MSSKRLVWAIYLVAIVMIAHNSVDLLANVWPPNVGSPGWRYGAAGFLSQYAFSPIFALVILGVNAWWNEHLLFLKVLAIVSLLGTLVMGMALVSFALDVVQVREFVSPSALPTFKTGAIKAAFKLGTLAAFLAYLALAFRQAARPQTLGTMEMANPHDVDWRPSEEPAVPDTD